MLKITRCSLLLILCIALIVEPFTAAAQVRKKNASKPNIIFILTDDLGYGDLGVFFQNQRRLEGDKGLPAQLTPNLDKLAASGARFSQQYCNAPVCAPSRASLLSGVNQGNALVRDNQFDKQLENNHNMATILRAAGYTTTAIGKWGLQGETKVEPNWPAHPLKRGFDEFFGYMRHADGHEHYPFEGLYRGKKEVYHNYKNITADLAKCYTTDLWTAFAKQWIVNHETEKGPAKPFFMFLAYDAPHAVLELPVQGYPEGTGLKAGLQWTGKPGSMINTASGDIDTYMHPDYAGTSWPDTYKRYATANRRLDDAVADLLKLLEDLKISENTLVVFTSDNGPSIESYLPAGYVANSPEFFGSFGPFDGIKRDVWEGGLRMPTLVCWPGQITPGKVISSASMLSDWLATFAEAAGVHAPARTTGVSLLPVLTGKGKQAESLVYVEYAEPGKTPAFKAFEPGRQGRKRGQMQMVRIGDLKGVRYDIQSADTDFEIYDVLRDPKESKNLAGLPGYLELQEQLKAKVLQMRKADKAAPRPYDTALIPALQVSGELLPGLTWKFYRGTFPWVTSEDQLNRAAAGLSKNIGESRSKSVPGMTLYEGYVKVAADGEYRFALQVTGKAYMKIHQAELIDADFAYQSGSEETGSVYLKAGYHPIKLYYLKELGKSAMVSLKMKYADSDWQPIKNTALFHAKQAE